ncbi:MAG: hypothetical protein ACXWBO_15490, partial [Ilumatobacteraceae bacterium]
PIGVGDLIEVFDAPCRRLTERGCTQAELVLRPALLADRRGVPDFASLTIPRGLLDLASLPVGGRDAYNDSCTDEADGTLDV